MTPWASIAAIIALLAFQDAIVWRTRGKYDQAAQEEILAAQVAQAAKKQQAAEAVAKATEADLLTEREKTAMLTKKLGVARASKTHTVCKLDAASLGVLKDATSPLHHLPR